MSIILLVFITSFFIQMVYYYLFYIRLSLKSIKKRKKNKKEGVSVIISAKNEAENLKKYLPSVLSQDYPDYEVIVVNDCSTDNTDYVLSEFKKNNKHLHITSIEPNEKFTHGKKLAITIGIKAAKNEWLLFTDADCEPVSNNWIKAMQNNFTNKNDIVLGYSGYKRKASLLNNIIRFDTFFIGLQYLSFALAGLPYMGVGRNMAYKKTLFFKNKGFASHLKLLSGDDDLFINETATKKNTKVVFSRDSIVLSDPKVKLNDWVKQKRRHIKTSKFYNAKTKLLLSGEIISRIFFYTSFIFLLVNNIFITYITYVLAFRLITQTIIWGISMKRLQEKYLFPGAIVYDIILPIFNFIFYLLNLVFSKRNQW